MRDRGDRPICELGDSAAKLLLVWLKAAQPRKITLRFVLFASRTSNVDVRNSVR